MKPFYRSIIAAAVLAVIALGGLTLVRSQAEQATIEASDEGVTVAETMTVATGDLTVTLDAAGSLEPESLETLSFAASAPIAEVLVEVGDQVRAGDVLAVLDTTDVEMAIRQSQLSVAQRRLSLDALLAPAEEIDIQLAELNVALANVQLYTASQSGSSAESQEIARLQEELARNSLWQSQLNRDMRVAAEEARGDVTWVEQQQYDSSVSSAEVSLQIAAMEYQDALSDDGNVGSLASANESLVRAQNSLDALLEGADADDVRAAEIAVERAQLSLAGVEEQLENYVLIAPFDGIVAAETLTAGALPSSGAITLFDPAVYTVELSIAESDVVDLAVGQQVMLTVQALSDAEVSGVITALDTTSTSSGQLVTYTAAVSVETPQGMTLRPGMSVVASILLESHEDVILIPNRFIGTDATTGGATVLVETEPGVYTTVPVTLGARSSDSSEVAGGLTVGQTLVLLAVETDDATTPGGLGLGILNGGGGPPAGGSFQPPAGGGPPAGGPGG
ncbi:MAG: HlyD family efflux transporter periplasmic adaptor subunit [Anaerolineae bacterium]|nr:HlyD family efflux transporter periplasmic adaptor subunit [Anaerolineae bacterium]NUQ06962.1 HlyD family efflux transporter periplasmic adaptor subunit [Anaerolineae bacterium]